MYCHPTLRLYTVFNELWRTFEHGTEVVKGQLERLCQLQVASVRKFTLVKCVKMVDQLRFDDRVAVITGAGAGLGKSYALLFARRGAAVVVNDLGVDISGKGKSSKAADAVIQQIRAEGGKAVADYNSVEDGDKIIQTALDNFGRIDILVNNAGILRDRSFARISDSDWDIIHNVHLKGSFKTTRSAWPHFRKQKYGRIIMTSSGAGLYGNFGQANYSAAKLGLVGLSNTLAIEGQKYGIQTNVIVPVAGSRLTEGILPPDLVDALSPDLIAPVVIWLCHESCEENGSVIEASAGWAGKYQWQRGKGAVIREGITDPAYPETVKNKWSEITDMSHASSHSSLQETTILLTQVLEELKEKQSSVSANKTQGMQSHAGEGRNEVSGSNISFPPSTFSYSSQDAILYALGVGISTKDEDYLKFLYEGSDEFSVLPTFGIIPAMNAVFSNIMNGIPGLEIDPSKILHGEQYVEVLKPLPAEGVLESRAHVTDVLDKGSGALIIADVDTYNEAGEKVIANQFSIFAMGSGNFGGKRKSDKVQLLASPPSRQPDVSLQFRTSVDQAALYRLSGDRNPLHIDPSFAAMGGFEQPILHGLCSYGIAARHVLKQFAGNDVGKFRAMKARFVKPVVPGQTLQMDMWQEQRRIYFRCQVVETGEVCLSGGYVDIADDSPVIHSEVSSGFRSDAFFHWLKAAVEASRSLKMKKTNSVILWNITHSTQATAQWTVDLKTNPKTVYVGPPKTGKADCTFTVEDQDMAAMATGELKPQVAYMNGKLKISGNLTVANTVLKLFQEYTSKL